MAYSGSGKSEVFSCLALFLIASSFSHCTILPRLRDTIPANSTRGQDRAKERETNRGRLLVGQNPLQSAKLKGLVSTELQDVDTEYQADMGSSHPQHPHGQIDAFPRMKQDNGAVEQILKMDPKVECTGDSMKLQFQGVYSTPGSLFFVDRGSNLSPLPLSKLPPSCGYSVQSTRKDVVLSAPYDGCFVNHEEDSYVLPLLWLGLPVRMSCPLMGQSSSNTPTVTCHAEGMVVKLESQVPVDEMEVKVSGKLVSLKKASTTCGFSIVEHPEGVIISIHNARCLETKNGMHTLELAGEMKFSCPLLSPAQTELTKIPGKVHNPHNEPQSTVPHAKLPLNPGGQVPQPSKPSKQPNQGPKDINGPLLPFFPGNHNFFNKYPANPDTKPAPTVHPPHPPVTKKNGLHFQQTTPHAKLPLKPEVQMSQPFKPNKQPNQGPKDINGPLLPFFPGNHNFLNYYPANPDTKPAPTVHPAHPPVTEKNDWLHFQQMTPQEKLPLNPEVQMPQPFYPPQFYFWPSHPEPPVGKLPGLPPHPQQPLPSTYPPAGETTIGQKLQPVNPFPFYPELTYPGPKPTSIAGTKSPSGHLEENVLNNPFTHPFSPVHEPASKPDGLEQKPQFPVPTYPQYPHPFLQMPAKQPSPTLAPEGPVQEPPPSQTHFPQGQVYPSSNPYPFYPEFGNPSAEKPTTVPKTPTNENPEGQMLKPHTQLPKIPDAGTNGGQSIQFQPYIPPLHCPQVCPPGISNCCPQIAFHQHVHHIVGFSDKDRNHGLPIIPPLGYAGFSNGFSSALPQTQAEVSPPVSPQTIPSGNEKQENIEAQDDNPVSLLSGNPSKPSNPEQYMYPLVVKPVDPTWSHLPQSEELHKLPQSQWPSNYNLLSEAQAPDNKPVIPVVHHEQDNVQFQNQQNGNMSVEDMTDPNLSKFMSFVSKYLLHRAKQQKKVEADMMLPSYEASPEVRAHSTIKSKHDHLLVPYAMLQDAEAPTSNESAVPIKNSLQPSVRDPEISTQTKQNVNTYSEPNKYVLLQHGPPGRERDGFSESPLPLKDLRHNANFQNAQNLNPPQEHRQQPKWLRKGISNPVPDINYMPGLGHKSEDIPLHFPASDGLHLVPLPKNPSSGDLESFRDFWKPMIPRTSRKRLRPSIPGKEFQQWRSASDHRANGLDNRKRREGEHLKWT